MRIVDVLWGLPYLLTVILLLVVMEPGVLTIIIALSVTGWLRMARLVRGQVLQLKEQEYVLAARTLGASGRWILFKHLLPQLLGPDYCSFDLHRPQRHFRRGVSEFPRAGGAGALRQLGNDDRRCDGGDFVG